MEETPEMKKVPEVKMIPINYEFNGCRFFFGWQEGAEVGLIKEAISALRDHFARTPEIPTEEKKANDDDPVTT